MKRYRDNFKDRLTKIDLHTMEESSYSIHALSHDLNLIYCNPKWMQFGKENGLKDFVLGTHITEIMGGKKVKDYYLENYNRVLDTGIVWHHDYECSSKNEYRQFHQVTYPMKNGEGLIIVNSLKVNQPIGKMDKETYASIKKRYIRSSGFITQCSNCRHTQRANQEDIWDWIPAWVEHMPENLSHSICPICLDYFWRHDKYEDYTSVVI